LGKGLLLKDGRTGDASVKNVGIQVRPIRPGYGSEVRIDADLREVGPLAQRLEDSAEAEVGFEIDHALNSVLELEMQAIIAEGSNGNNVFQHTLLQWRDRFEVRLSLRQFPIFD